MHRAKDASARFPEAEIPCPARWSFARLTDAPGRVSRLRRDGCLLEAVLVAVDRQGGRVSSQPVVRQSHPLRTFGQPLQYRFRPPLPTPIPTPLTPNSA